MSRHLRRPMLRYHGGKWRSAPWIIAHLPQHTAYVEPFGGAASVLLRKPRSKIEVLNDLDDEIVNIYRVLRNPDSAAELERLLRLTPFARAEFQGAYERADEAVERARRTLVKAMMGWGTSGLVRSLTGFRTPTHRSRSQSYAVDWAHYPDALAAFTDRLSGVQIENRPALELIEMMDAPDALIYCDPPYPHATRGIVGSQGRNGYTHEMLDEDHRALAEALHACQAAVVISGYACPLYDEELYAGWRRVTRAVRINGKRGGERRTEVLWLNDRAGIQQRSLWANTGGST